MADIKVVYFDFRGKGELIRLVLHAAGISFTDERIAFKDWADGLKNTLPTPSGMLPYMEYNGKPYAESQAIARFLAKKYGFVCKNDEDNLQADSVTCQVEDVRQLVYDYKHMDDQEQTKVAKEAFMTKKCPTVFDRFEKMLAANGKNGHFVGDSLTLADLDLFDLCDLVDHEMPDFVAKYPNISKLRGDISNIPGISGYLKTRKQTDI